jgi:transcriptional regulator with XRE-family HTH domain
LTPDIESTETESVGGRLRRLRVERGMSQRELSAPGVSYAYISRIEAGARRPSVKALRMLARKLGVSPEYLETGSEIRDTERRELRLADAELRLRLDQDDVPVADLEEILAESESLGDAVAASRARIVLGLVAARAGDNRKAIAYLETAVESDLVAASSRPDVFATLGRAYASAGEPGKAVELFERGLDETERESPDDVASQVRFATYLSYALTDLGELDRARSVVQDALQHGENVVDPYTRVRLYWSLGRISLESNKPLIALEHFRRAVALLEATEDTLHLARAHLAVAGSAILTDALDDAGRHLDTADRLLGPRPEPIDRVMLLRMRADLAVRRGDAETAVRLGAEAAEAASDLPAQRGLALAAQASGLALTNETRADAVYREAIELLLEHGTRRDRADAVRAYARYLRTNGRDGEALDVLERLTEPEFADR